MPDPSPALKSPRAHLVLSGSCPQFRSCSPPFTKQESHMLDEKSDEELEKTKSVRSVSPQCRQSGLSFFESASCYRAIGSNYPPVGASVAAKVRCTQYGQE
jgi:hypothetical protein